MSRSIDLQYRKAVFADPANAEVLRQFTTFHKAYDRWGRGEELRSCPLCQINGKCERCALLANWEEHQQSIPPGPLGRRRRLKSIENVVMNESPPIVSQADVAATTERTDEPEEGKSTTDEPASDEPTAAGRRFSLASMNSKVSKLKSRLASVRSTVSRKLRKDGESGRIEEGEEPADTAPSTVSHSRANSVSTVNIEG